MKLHKVLLLTLCLLSLIPQITFGQEPNSTGLIRRHDNAVPNNYIVVFKDSVPQGRVHAFAMQLASAHGG
ncbi:MAG TPA: hypothetical protein VD835_14055, partial [Pyrinomonadaceae bacterium]|nr:hypothetical protein [Pyrinomonadaceae bacterium]